MFFFFFCIFFFIFLTLQSPRLLLKEINNEKAFIGVVVLVFKPSSVPWTSKNTLGFLFSLLKSLMWEKKSYIKKNTCSIF